MRHACLLSLVLVAAAGTATSASAQCSGQWLPGESAPGANSLVQKLSTGNSLLYLGGIFGHAGGLNNHGGATWDGVAFGELPTLEVYPTYLTAFGELNGKLYAAGRTALDLNTYRYWVAVQEDGVLQQIGLFDKEVKQMQGYQGQLYVAGGFTAVNGNAVNGLARWTGSLWEPFSTGGSTTALGLYADRLFAGAGLWDGATWTSLGDPRLSIRSVAEWNGQLVVCGGYGYDTDVRLWNGTNWEDVGVGPNGNHVNDLAVYEGKLVVGGLFTKLGDGRTANHVAIYDGVTWESMGAGVNAEVNGVEVYQGRLIIAGGFGLSGDMHVYEMAEWIDGAWWPLSRAANDPIQAFANLDGRLIAGGTFNTIGGVVAQRIAAFDGAAWAPLGSGMDGGVNALLARGNRVVAAGAFSLAGGVPAARIAEWDGTAWSALGSGMNGDVYALAEFNGDLIAAGNFTTAGGVTAYRIARWDGSTWSPMGSGMNNFVYSLVVWNGELYAGGEFNYAGASIKYVARWTGTKWAALGLGANYTVRSLAVYNNELVAAGDFTTAGYAGVNRVARWNGSAWTPLGGGLDARVRSIWVHQGQLFAGGEFAASGIYPDVVGIASWDGTRWQPVSGGLDTAAHYMRTPGVWALGSFGDQLVAGGHFTNAGGTPSAFFARWLPTDSDADGVCDDLDTCPDTITGATVDPQGCPLALRFDFNQDGDVDVGDLEAFASCATGPALGPADSACDPADSDDDGDIDQTDFAAFQRCYSGTDVVAGNCP